MFNSKNQITRWVDKDEMVISVDNILDKFFSENFPNVTKDFGVNFFEKQSYPKVNVIEYEDTVEIKAEIPGVPKKNVSVEIKDDVLVISGEKSESSEEKRKPLHVIRRELKHSNFKRSFALGDNINKESVTAKFDEGILTVILSKIKPEKPKINKVTIQ